jgi:hypothetical protein
MERGKLRPLVAFIVERERESASHDPARRRRSTDGWPIRWGRGTTIAPLLRLDSRVGMIGLKQTNATVHLGRAQIINPTIFLLFKLAQVRKIPK